MQTTSEVQDGTGHTDDPTQATALASLAAQLTSWRRKGSSAEAIAERLLACQKSVRSALPSLLLPAEAEALQHAKLRKRGEKTERKASQVDRVRQRAAAKRVEGPDAVLAYLRALPPGLLAKALPSLPSEERAALASFRRRA